MRDIEISPSILSADFAHLADELEEIVPYIDCLHMDVMDGHFVPNITVGPVVSNSLKGELRELPFHIHLMITDPLEYAPRFEAGREDTIIFHLEAAEEPRAAIEEIREMGTRVGISMNPDTDTRAINRFLPRIDEVLVMSVVPGFGGQEFRTGALDKIEYLREEIDKGDYTARISVDGGINPSTGKMAVEAGADLLVAGSAIFSSPDRLDAVKRLRSSAEGG